MFSATRIKQKTDSRIVESTCFHALLLIHTADWSFRSRSADLSTFIESSELDRNSGQDVCLSML